MEYLAIHTYTCEVCAAEALRWDGRPSGKMMKNKRYAVSLFEETMVRRVAVAGFEGSNKQYFRFVTFSEMIALV